MGTQWVLKAEFIATRYCVVEAPDNWTEQNVQEWACDELLEASLDTDAAWSIYEESRGTRVQEVWPRQAKEWSCEPSPLLGKVYDLEQEILKPDLLITLE